MVGSAAYFKRTYPMGTFSQFEGVAMPTKFPKPPRYYRGEGVGRSVGARAIVQGMHICLCVYGSPEGLVCHTQHAANLSNDQAIVICESK